MRQRVSDAGEPLDAETSNVLQAPIVRGSLEILERLNAQVVVQSQRQPLSDARHRRQHRHGIRCAAQSIEHRQAAARNQLANRSRDARSHAWQLLEAVEAAPAKDDVQRVRPSPHGGCGAKIGVDPIGIGALVAQQPGGFLEARSDFAIHRVTASAYAAAFAFGGSSMATLRTAASGFAGSGTLTSRTPSANVALTSSSFTPSGSGTARWKLPYSRSQR